MQIVIDISDNDYEYLKNTYFVEDEKRIFEQTEEDRKSTITLFRLINAIKNGTPLPKGHGDLIDRQSLINNGIEKGFCDWYDEIKYASTIIEADKPESEGET